MKRYLAAILAVLLLLTALAGCKGKEEAADNSKTPETQDTPTDSGAPTGTQDTPTETNGTALEMSAIDFDKAYAAYAPETPMLYIDGYTVTWDELFLYLCSILAETKASTSAETGWTTALGDGRTLAETVLALTEESAANGRSLHYGAELVGAKLNETELALVESSYQQAVVNYGSEEAFVAALKQSYCYSKELFNYLVTTNALADACFNQMYGMAGEKLSDADAEEFTADDGYLMAKHILISTVNDDEARTEKTDEEKAAALALANEIYTRLAEYDGDDFDAFFSEQMTEYSEDPGSISNPGGYLFQNGNMVEEFYDTTVSLKIGELSEPVKSIFGYHIIYRVPINYDSVPAYYAQQGYPLRYIAAWGVFSSVRSGWQDNLEITYSKEYEALDLAKVFG